VNGEAARSLNATKGKIVPFVHPIGETKRVSICYARGDEGRTRVEVVVELMLIAAGVAGVIAGMIGR
jgi:hypothetical protein